MLMLPEGWINDKQIKESCNKAESWKVRHVDKENDILNDMYM